MDVFTINRLGRHGDGIAKGPDGPLYVPRTLPGEAVTGVVNSGRIDRPKIVTPSTNRVSAPCPHYGACGGCALLHAGDAFVAAWKQDIVRTALGAQGLEAPIRGIATSPPRSRRRAALSARRTKSGAVVGFHGRASGAITPVPHCHVLTDGLRAALPALDALTRAGASRKAEMTFTMIETPAGVDVAAAGGKPHDHTLAAELGQIAGNFGLARLTWNDETVAQAAPPTLSFGRAPVVPPPGAFLQATAEGAAALRGAVDAAVVHAGRIADLFAGCGTFALPLAERAEVTAVEGDPALLEALETGWRSAGGLRALRALRRDLFRDPLSTAELGQFDAVVIDPPRAGAEAQTKALAASAVPRIAAVSCNPATFARDAACLVTGGYRMDWLEVVDQFRWSAHVELAAQFTRA